MNHVVNCSTIIQSLDVMSNGMIRLDENSEWSKIIEDWRQKDIELEFDDSRVETDSLCVELKKSVKVADGLEDCEAKVVWSSLSNRLWTQGMRMKHGHKLMALRRSESHCSEFFFTISSWISHQISCMIFSFSIISRGISMNFVALTHHMPNYTTVRADRPFFLTIEFVGIVVPFVRGIKTPWE